MARIEDGFRSTLSGFQKRLTQKEMAHFKISSLEDVQKVIASIQSEQGHQKEMMNFTKIQSFLEGMDQFGKIIEIFLNASEFVAFIWGPVKFVLQVRRLSPISTVLETSNLKPFQKILACFVLCGKIEIDCDWATLCLWISRRSGVNDVPFLSVLWSSMMTRYLFVNHAEIFWCVR